MPSQSIRLHAALTHRFRVALDPFRSSFFASNGSVLPSRRRLRRVELPVARLDAASPLVPGNRGAAMVRTSALACRSDFLLCLASCEGKNLIVEAQRAALAASGFCGRSALEPARSPRSGRFRRQHPGRNHQRRCRARRRRRGAQYFLETLRSRRANNPGANCRSAV